ncbi:flavodoxin family protein [Nocardioides marmorisolisilvae]|uniref:NADPH-dependent oxidoreductase n=1 Tax=Nocardioides marmorisolisilvae TaxID=1542737 RepID=A0A3N0DXL9_9ACTN|nr:NAD(P)H-dependent oxidoreductase [Nocardioides marmorisolisilvae]RNL80362.1 NADPH-dependent oxidoreductase [Nocardioides marmorisolisilvae]
MTNLHAVALVCTLTKSPGSSSSQLLAEQVLEQLAEHECSGEVVRVVDEHIAFGVSADEGEGDGWPALREKVLAADIVVIATPIWMGQPSSVCKMALERLDAELSETDPEGRPSMFGKVAAMAVVGNEDGAHHVTAEVSQALLDVGFSIPAQAVTYWVGEAMGSTDYQDLDKTPEKTAGTTRTLAANAAHLARMLRAANYPVPT